jgi:hypothetical protein
MQLNDTVTLQGLKQDIYFKGKITANTLDQNDLQRIINIYYKQVQAAVRALNEDFFMVTAKADLQPYTINNGVYTFPATYEKIKSYWVAILPQNPVAPLYSEYQRCNVIDANAITDPSYQFDTPTIVNFGTYFVLYPELTNTPQTIYPVTDGMKIYMIPVQPDLVNDTDVPLIFSDYHDIISWGSLIDIAQRLGKPDLKAKAEKAFKDRMAEMKSDASLRILSMESSIVEGQGNQGGWSYPWGNTHEM